MPLAAHAQWLGNTLRIQAAWGDPDESATPAPLVCAELQDQVTDLQGAADMGQRVAQLLCERGAKSLR